LVLLDDDEITKDLRVYALADRFLMEELKEYAFQKFNAKIWISDMFIDCVREVYCTTANSDRRMRDSVVKIAVKNICELWQKGQFLSLVREGGDFTEDMITTLLETNNIVSARALRY
jgi:hypothetical protein